MPVFPLSTVPSEGYHKSAGHNRWFGGRRDGGRLHAACDLMARQGTPVYAVDTGNIIKVTDFYKGTDQIIIKHLNFIVRYGEVEKGKLPFNHGAGYWVRPGQLIGWVGRLNMLHFEMYQGTSEGYLSQDWNKTNYKYVNPGNYYRRPDLLDPTPYLDQWKASTFTFNYEEENATAY
jgi:murein DD-endopeptidase MepM/ murein hydrolase activator NlpD